MFRNLRFYRLQGEWPASEQALSAALAGSAFTPCGPLTERSSGWIPIHRHISDLHARRLNGAELFRLRSQSRMLPPAAINEALEERIEEYRARQGEEPSPREKRRLKAETRDQLLPKALLRSERIWGYIDLAENIIGIDSASENTCERFLRCLRIPLDTLSMRPLEFEQPIGDLLLNIFLGDAPARFALGRECVMLDAKDAGAKVRWTDFDLQDKTIRDHVADGMRLTQLAIEYDNVLSCTINASGVLSKVRILGADAKEARNESDPVARLDAEFVLLTGTVRQLLADLKSALGGVAKAA